MEGPFAQFRGADREQKWTFGSGPGLSDRINFTVWLRGELGTRHIKGPTPSSTSGRRIIFSSRLLSQLPVWMTTRRSKMGTTYRFGNYVAPSMVLKHVSALRKKTGKKAPDPRAAYARLSLHVTCSKDYLVCIGVHENARRRGHDAQFVFRFPSIRSLAKPSHHRSRTQVGVSTMLVRFSRCKQAKQANKAFSSLFFVEMGNETSTMLLNSVRDALQLNYGGGKRLEVIKEICGTERTYCAMLERLKEYQEKLLQLNLIKPAAAKTIFCGSETLLAFHRSFLAQLEARVESSSSPSIIVGDIFLEYVDMMPMYTAAINNFEYADAAVLELRKSKAFQAFEKEQKKSFKSLGLQDCLIAPVQRLPRYLLLMKALAAVTSDSHSDHQSIVTAIFEMEAILQSVNSSKRTSEAREQLFGLQRRLDKASDSIVAPARSILASFETICLKKSAEEKLSKHRKGFVAVCSDALLIAWQSGPFGGKLLLKHSISYANLNVSTVESSDELSFNDVFLRFENESASVACQEAIASARNPILESPRRVARRNVEGMKFGNGTGLFFYGVVGLIVFFVLIFVLKRLLFSFNADGI